MDSFVNMVMRNPAGANETTYGIEDILNNYEVNTVGLHLLLWTAQSMGIKAGVHIGTRSVHFQRRGPGRPDRPLPGRGDDGARRRHGLRLHQGSRRADLPALRRSTSTCASSRCGSPGPRTREAYLAERRVPIHKDLYVLDEEDLANAILSALEVVKVGRNRFDAILISGDEHEVDHNMTKAKVMLGWAPQSQRYLEE